MHTPIHCVLLLLAILALLSCTTAAPTSDETPRDVGDCNDFTDTIDEAAFVLAPQTSSVGMYNGVTYAGFGMSSKSVVTGTAGGVYPQSGSNVASATIVTDAIQIGQATLQPFGTIVASPSQSFDLEEAWFACVLLQGSPQVASVPVGCTISVAGFGKDNMPVPAVSFSFSPPNPLGSSMTYFQLPYTFRYLKNATFGIATTSFIPPPNTVLYLDSVKHCNYN
ncbi:hypothetical protein H2200_007336 [Cladophialophora chaetospira]|uniref:Uncharacterized protein n=1 Tax=Cladophialophora chaetospira TaxID=386627 RepID=A0AA38X878_9EURO|nr:hypothetical protein H2200_007336 [Cladophialophora chaetospira]